MELFGVCSEADIWVEGIGSLFYGITGMNVLYTGSDAHLEKCAEEDRILYSQSGGATGIGEAELFENEKMRNGENEKRGGVYDLQGRRLGASLNDKGQMTNEKLRKGIYIRDDRKVVVK